MAYIRHESCCIFTNIQGKGTFHSTVRFHATQNQCFVFRVQDAMVALLQDLAAIEGHDRSCSSEPFNRSWGEDDIWWSVREFDKTPEVTVASALAGSYWNAVKSNAEDVVGYSSSILGTLRDMYTGAHKQSTVGCAVQVGAVRPLTLLHLPAVKMHPGHGARQVCCLHSSSVLSVKQLCIPSM
jgi:hypothetical protein